MKRVLGFLVGVGLALALFVIADHITRPAKAQATFLQDTVSAPLISFTPDVLLRFWSQQAQARAVNTDAQWATAMATIFSTASFPGADPTALAFLRSFFTQYVHVGP